eukprot:GEMP01004025.1.p1 GENE.GEMP01004025.1~~GEMP01004025.1.p1  ORF type:complete len:939 (+),score=279.37 GEMP01004025.1:79-2895(+)
MDFPSANERASGVSRRYGTGTEDVDYNASLQNKLAMETADKDGAKTELRHLKKIVETHRNNLAFLSEERGSEHVWLRMEDAFYQLDQDINVDAKNARHAIGDDAASPRRTYDVLRSSLTDSQRRVESLNYDMKHQQNANSELVRSLGTVKDTNRRLLEQIQHQTAEITQLTTQRVSDEYKLEEMQKQHRQEESMWHKDLQRRLQQRKQNLEDRYEHEENQYTDRLNYIKTRAGVLLAELHNLRQAHIEMKSEHASNHDAMMTRLQIVEKDIFQHLEKQAERHLQSRAYLQANVQDLDQKLTSEKNLRVHEVAAWKQKHASFQAEKDDTADSLGREITLRTSQVHCMDRTVQSEQAQNTERRQKLEQTVKAQLDEKNSLERTLENVNRESFRLESQVGTLESDEKMKEQQLQELRREMRQTEDSLSGQQNANEHLRQQLEEQRERFQSTNDKELQRARIAADEKLVNLREQRDKEEQLGRQQLAALADMISSREADLERKKQQCEAVTTENNALERDVQMWKNMFEQCNKQRQDQERDLAHLRQEWTRQRLSVQETTDITEQKRQTAENDFEIMSSQFVEFKRQSSARETEIASRIGALEDMLKTTKYHLADGKSQLSDTTEALRKIKTDSLAGNQKQMEAIHKLERDLDQQNLEWQDEKKRLDSAIETERRNTSEHRERYDKWKETHANALRQIQEDTTVRLQNYEREKNRLTDKYRQEVDHAKKDLELNQRKVDQLRDQISRSRNSYHESQGALESIKRETERNERSLSVMKHQHSDELRTVQSASDAARKSEVSMSRQYEQSKARHEQDRNKLLKDFEDAKAGGSSQLTEAEKRMQTTKQDYEGQLNNERHRLSTDMVLERSKMDGLTRENDQLKKILGDRSSAVVADLPRASYAFDKTNFRTTSSPPRGHSLNISPRSPKINGFGARGLRNPPLI